MGTEQIDALCALADRLPADLQPRLADDLAGLVSELGELTPPRAVKRLLEWERSHDVDDGKTRLDGQRRSNRFGYAKNPDGTTNIFGRLDPISAETVRRAVDAKVTELWRLEAKGRSGMAPPGETLTNPQRRAKALVELIAAGAVAPPGPVSAGVLVLIDHQTLLDQIAANPIARLADGTQLPAGEARRLACDADIIL